MQAAGCTGSSAGASAFTGWPWHCRGLQDLSSTRLGHSTADSGRPGRQPQGGVAPKCWPEVLVTRLPGSLQGAQASTHTRNCSEMLLVTGWLPANLVASVQRIAATLEPTYLGLGPPAPLLRVPSLSLPGAEEPNMCAMGAGSWGPSWGTQVCRASMCVSE